MHLFLGVGWDGRVLWGQELGKQHYDMTSPALILRPQSYTSHAIIEE